MITTGAQHGRPEQDPKALCAAARGGFGDYMDGTATGVAMSSVAAHLDGCEPCARAFAGERLLQDALASLGRKRAPERLQRDLQAALALERARSSHLPWNRRLVAAWNARLEVVALRFVGGLCATVVLLCGAVSFLGMTSAVQANDDNMTHPVAPHYLYSQVPATPVMTRHDVPVLVEAKVDTGGRVYDYQIIDGPADAQTRLQVERNLLTSVFQPATLFGVPVRGDVVITYSGVSVRG